MSGRWQVEGELVEGGGGVDALALLAVDETSGALEDAFELAQFLGRDVHGELGVADADEFGINVQGAVEVVADHISAVTVTGEGAVTQSCGQRVLPLGEASQEDDVLAGEFAEGREFLERGGVALEDVLEGAHCHDAVAVAVLGLDGRVGGLPAGNSGVDHGALGIEGLGLGARRLNLQLPARD